MVTYRLTPWDTRAFGFNTAELFFDPPFDKLTGEYLAIEKELKAKEVTFIYTRINGQDFHLRKELQTLGFYFAESSLKVVKPKIQRFTPEKLPPLQYLKATQSDLPVIKNIARDSFHFSRFHEDAHIEEHLSRNRYFNWIEDLVNQQATIMIAKVGEQTIGFNIQKENLEKKESELILAGCADGMQLYALSLWNQIIDHNKSMGINKILTLISASNVGVFNVYSHFDFKVQSTLFGFHKWL